MRVSGVILELRAKEAILINNRGEYQKIKRTELMFEGQMIEYNTFDIIRNNNRKIAAYASSIAAVMLVALVLSLYSFNSVPLLFAYIDIDINPSVEFSIDDKGRVIDTRPLNDEAKTLLETCVLKKLNISEAFTQILEKSKDLGYIKEEGNVVLVSASGVIKEPTEETTAKLDVFVNSLKEITEKENKGIAVQTMIASSEMVKASQNNNLSIGRYVCYSSALKNGVDITIDEATKLPIRELVKYQEGERAVSTTDNANVSKSKNDKVVVVTNKKPEPTVNSKSAEVLDKEKSSSGSASNHEKNEVSTPTTSSSRTTSVSSAGSKTKQTIYENGLITTKVPFEADRPVRLAPTEFNLQPNNNRNPAVVPESKENQNSVSKIFELPGKETINVSRERHNGQNYINGHPNTTSTPQVGDSSVTSEPNTKESQVSNTSESTKEQTRDTHTNTNTQTDIKEGNGRAYQNNQDSNTSKGTGKNSNSNTNTSTSRDPVSSNSPGPIKSSPNTSTNKSDSGTTQKDSHGPDIQRYPGHK